MSIQASNLGVPPGPKKNVPMSSFTDNKYNPLQFLLKMTEYGRLARVQVGHSDVFVVNEPDLVHEVLVANANCYRRPMARKALLEPFLGDGLAVSEGEIWRRHRKLMQPAFHSSHIGTYADIMVKYAIDMGTEGKARSESGKSYAIDKASKSYSLRVIIKALLNLDMVTESHPIINLICETLEVEELMPKLRFLLPQWVPTAYNRRQKKAIAQLDAEIYRLIDERRKLGTNKGDILSMLLSARDKNNNILTDEEVRDEIITLVLGNRTTSSALTWMWYLLSQHPEVVTKLHAELDRVLHGRLPTFEDMPQLPYTEMIVKETIRLYPPTWLGSRELTEDTLLDGYAAKKGQVVILNVYGLSHDARFFPDPDRFDPERFNSENEGTIPHYAYLPFSAGPHTCIGNTYALIQLRLVLATLAQNYHLELAPDCIVVPYLDVTIVPKFGLNMILKPRVLAATRAESKQDDLD